MKMKDFWEVYDSFFTTIEVAKIFVQRVDEMGFPYHYNKILNDMEIMDVACNCDEWYWKDYIIEGIGIIDNVLHIICRE